MKNRFIRIKYKISFSYYHRHLQAQNFWWLFYRYYRTTDSPPILATEKCAEKTDQAATRFWAEIFGTIHIGTAFVTAFILQFLRFILFSIVRPLTVGILQLLGDYLIKPLLSIVFNALIQPIIILFYNIATSLRDLCEPLAEAVGLFLREIANLCRGIRIVEIKHTNAAPNTCTQSPRCERCKFIRKYTWPYNRTVVINNTCLNTRYIFGITVTLQYYYCFVFFYRTNYLLQQLTLSIIINNHPSSLSYILPFNKLCTISQTTNEGT